MRGCPGSGRRQGKGGSRAVPRWRGGYPNRKSRGTSASAMGIEGRDRPPGAQPLGRAHADAPEQREQPARTLRPDQGERYLGQRERPRIDQVSGLEYGTELGLPVEQALE